MPFQRLGVNFWAGFIHDDIKLSQRITLNLGLRYEFETAPQDLKEPQLSRYLDLSQPIPEMQNNPPVLPAEVTAIRTKAPTYNGAWLFTDSSNRGTFNTDKTIFMPRVGIAIRINDKTAFRAGYARYVVPPLIIRKHARHPQYALLHRSDVSSAAARRGSAGASQQPFPRRESYYPAERQFAWRYTNLGDNPT